MFTIFIVSSAINSYIPSVYSQFERFNQTILTIQSIRKYVKDSYIILYDATSIDNVYSENIKNYVNYYYDLSTNNKAVEYSRKDKSLGEVYSTKLVIDRIIQTNLQYNLIIKLSGRYVLNNKFSIQNFSNTLFTFSSSQEHQRVYHTTCYSFKNAKKFLVVLNSVFSKLLNCESLNIESALYDVLKDDFTKVELIKECGVNGCVSGNGCNYTH